MRPSRVLKASNLTDRRRCLQAIFWGITVVLNAGAGQAQLFSVEQGIPAGLLSPSPGVHWGRFEFHGGSSATVTYDDNVTGSATATESDVVWTLAPFGSVRTEGPNGRTLMLAYRPSYL